MVTVDTFVVQLLNGLSIGFSIALIAIGMTLIFGIMDIVNFAHGEFYMMGAYGTIVILPFVGNYWIGLIIAAVAVSIMAAVMDKLTLEPIRDRPPLQSLIVTFGLVLILQRAAFEIFSGTPRSMPTPISGGVELLGVTYPASRLAIIVGSLLIMGVTWLFLERTRMGIYIRATAQDLTAARTLGVPAPRVFTLVFAISAGLAALAAGFLAPIRSVYPTMGVTVILEAFIVVIVGGLGSLTGAVLAALLIGVVQSMTVLFAPAYMAQITSFVILIVVLLVRPEGIMGGRQ